MAVGPHTFTVIFSGLFNPNFPQPSIVIPYFERTLVLFTTDNSLVKILC
jgi:hypothetical protein